MKGASTAMTKDDKALLRHWQSQNLGKVPRAEDVEMLQAQTNNVLPNDGFLIKKYLSNQRLKIKKRLQKLKMKPTEIDPIAERMEWNQKMATPPSKKTSRQWVLEL